MTQRLFFLISTCTLIACAANSDDDDDGFTFTPTPSPSGTATATPTPTGSPTPTPPAITPLSSFTNGAEIWLCLRAQFDGSLSAFALDGGAGCLATVAQSVPVTSAVPKYFALRIKGVSCPATGEHWNIDYLVDGDRCQGCVNQEFAVDYDADDPYGTLCGTGGTLPPPVADLSAYLAQTTGLLRFNADILPGYASVSITGLVINDLTNLSITDCTATAVISNGGDGLFDATCNPAVTSTTFVVGQTYRAYVIGNADGYDYHQYFIFDYVASP